MSAERPNLHPIYLPTEFYLAIADVIAKKRIGKSAAILLMINEGLRQTGFLDEETYLLYRTRYSTPLMEKVEKGRTARTTLKEEKVRCGWSGCRRLAISIVKWKSSDSKSQKKIPVCPDHLKEARLKPSCEVLSEEI
jgi:hypothetical protein